MFQRVSTGSDHFSREGSGLDDLTRSSTFVQPSTRASPLLYYCYLFIFSTRIYFPASGQTVVTGVVPSPPRFSPSIFIAHWVQQSHCSSIFPRVLLTHALALSASQFVRKKKSPRICTSMHSGGFELTKLNYTRLEDNLIRHRGDRRILVRDSELVDVSSIIQEDRRKGTDGSTRAKPIQQSTGN